MVRSFRHEKYQPSTAVEALREQFNADDLKPMVRAFVGGKPPTRKDDLVAGLVALLEGDALRRVWNKLSPLGQAAVAETAWADDGVFHRDPFKSKYGKLPSVEGVSEAEAKQAAGGSFYGRPGRSPSLLDVLIPEGVMARDVQQRLRAFVPKPAAANVKTLDAPPDHVDIPAIIWNPSKRTYDHRTEAVPVERREVQWPALHDVAAVLRVVDAGKAAVTEKHRRPTPATMRAVAEVLDGGDFFFLPPAGEKKAKQKKNTEDWEDEEQAGPVRAFAWPMLVQAGKLAQMSSNRLALTKSGRAALSAPPHLVLRDVWRRWLDTELLDELRRIEVIRGQTGGGRRHLTDPAKRRRAIAAALAECPVGQWVALDEFSRYMRAAGHRFQVTREPWSLYIAEQQYGSLGYEGYGGWNILQLRYLLCFLMEYAATLGLVDVAYVPPAGARLDFGDLWGTDDLAFFSRYDGLQALRLNPLGAFCLGLSKDYAPPAMEARSVLEIRPDHTVAATGPLTPADRMLLDAFARPLAEGEWQLDAIRILSAAAEGREVGELAEFLESAGGGPLPEFTAAFLADLQRRLVMFTDQGPARLIRCTDPALADAIFADPAARKACYRVDEQTLAVPARAEAAFRRALEKFGYVLPPADAPKA